MSATNDNTPPLWTPVEFAGQLAQYVSDRDHALSTGESDALNAAEAKRMQLIEAYERAYRGGWLKTV